MRRFVSVFAGVFFLLFLSAGYGGQAKDQGTASPQNQAGPPFKDPTDPVEQSKLGYYCEKNSDWEQAVKWYRKAAEQQNLVAQNNLATCYVQGQGVAQDYAEAVKWYRKAADQGYVEAQSSLGACYTAGYGVAQDYAEAVKWYAKAAQQQDSSAQLKRGYCHAKGYGVPQDLAKAFEWYKKSAEQGNARAQFCLAACYYQGQGVAQDYVQAYRWFSISGASQEESIIKHTKELLGEFSREMTSAQLVEAQRLAREWKPKTPE